jgi:autotransporter-associated beta strand protein
MSKSLFTAITVVVAAVFVTSAPIADASNWTGGNANWSSNGNPGWNGTGVPNGVGVTANHGVSTTTTTTQDVVGGVTVGTISLTNNSNNGWTFTNTNGITLNQDGAGAGTATISNTDTTAGTANQLIIGPNATTSLVLADDLLISNTGASTQANGAIQIMSLISGTGNITFSTVGNTVTNTGTFPGAIRIQTAANTFTGNSLIQKGAVTFNNAASFGPATNAITLGASGQGSASLLGTNAITWNAWPITVAAGSGGTLTLGSVSTTGVAIPGQITLNGDVTLRAESTGGQTTNFTGKVTGVGNITVTGTGATPGVVTLSNNANDFTGTVTVNTGNLLITQSSALGATTAGTTVASGAQLRTNNNITVAEPLTLNGAGTASDGAIRTNQASNPTFTGPITLGSNTLLFNNATAGAPSTPTISGAITGTNTDLTVSSLNSDGNWVISGSINTGTGQLIKPGAGIVTLSGANVYSGGTTVSAGTLLANNTSGSATGSGNVSVAAGATLGGTGSIGGAGGSVVSVNGTLSPGASIESLSVVGNVLLNNNSTYKYELSTTATYDADLTDITGPGGFGLLSIGSNVTLSATDLTPGFIIGGVKFTLFRYNTGGWNGGTFTGLPDGKHFFIGPHEYVIDYNDTTAGLNSGTAGGEYVTITTIPEANAFVTVGFVAISAAGAFWFGKRRGWAFFSV